MNRYFNDKSNYDKYPVVNVPGMEGECRVGWEAISDCLNKDLSQIDKKVKIVVLAVSYTHLTLPTICSV